MDFGRLWNRLILAPGMRAAVVILIFGCFFGKNVSMRNFTNPSGTVDFGRLRDRLILAPGMRVTVVILIFANFFEKKTF